MSENVERIATDRWRNRRRMAWVSFGSTILYPFLAAVLGNEVVTKLAVHHYTFTTAVVMTYIAGSVVDHWLQKEKS